MRFRIRRIRKPQVFAALMIGATVLVLLPRDVMAPARHAVQLVAIAPQRAGTGVSRALAGATDFGARPISREEYEKLLREKTMLDNEIATLRREKTQLQGTIKSIGGLRDRGLKQGVLVPATVIALDAAGGRDSLLLGKGRIAGIRNEDWVTSRLLLGSGSEEGITDQSAVLAHECLIGWIEDVSALSARVVLLSDPVARRSINVSILPPGSQNARRLEENGREVSFALEGVGGGKMRVLDIFHEYVEKKQLQEGDWVVSQPSPRLPASLVIGRIEKFERVKQKPVYYTATVAPTIDPRSLEQVFVVDLSRPPGS